MKVANQESKQSSEGLTRVANDTPRHAWVEGAIAILDLEGRLVTANPPLVSWLDAESGTLTGCPLLSLLLVKYPSWDETLRPWWQSCEVFQTIQMAADNGGTKACFQIESVRTETSRIVRIGSVLPPSPELTETPWDEYLQGLPALRSLYMRSVRLEAQLDNLVKRWPGVIFSQRPDLTFDYVSPAIEDLTGLSTDAWASPPTRFWQVIHEADTETVRHQIQRCRGQVGGSTATYRVRNVRTGRVTYVTEHRRALVSGAGLVLGYEGSWLDVTRQTIAEKRLSTASWKETLAVLTLGLAHDFSNVIAGIHSLSESFLAQLDDKHPFYEGLALIKRNSLQAGDLSHRIIGLHRGKSGERSYHDLNEVVRDSVELVSKIVPRRIQVSTQLNVEGLPVFADLAELRQVIINLTRNAVDAMPRGGELRFITERCADQLPRGSRIGSLPRLPAVCLAVQDTGCGIPQRLWEQIFDPFFTTKPLNEGSGLGLYNARLFVEKHQGMVTIDSTENVGSTFRIWLPEADFTEAEIGPARVAAKRKTILLLGPSGKRLESTAEFLRLHSYQAIVASQVDHASEHLNAAEFDVAGIMLLVEGRDLALHRWIDQVRRGRRGIRTIARIAGCNQDELDSRFLQQFDLVIHPDSPETDMIENLRLVFESPRSAL